MAATKTQFFVADLETTGLKSEPAELLELAGLVVEPDGKAVSEVSVLGRVPIVPTEIIELTGIAPEEVRTQGCALSDALAAFVHYTADRLVFFYNTPFGNGLANAVAKKAALAFRNAVHDTLPLAIEAWPNLRTYRLASLSGHVKGVVPRHRAMANARATFDELRASRRAIESAYLEARLLARLAGQRSGKVARPLRVVNCQTVATD